MEAVFEVDMLVASKTMDDADFAALRKEAQQAHDEVRFLKGSGQLYGEIKKQHEAAQKEAAKDAVKVLQEAIPEWSNELYNDIRGYAIAQGLPEENVNTIVDPIVIQILNKSRLYDQGSALRRSRRRQRPRRKSCDHEGPAKRTNSKRAKPKRHSRHCETIAAPIWRTRFSTYGALGSVTLPNASGGNDASVHNI